jgi:methylated-DNA-[protein]-cysteine S-methyltransferase/AraC family transcriptional regulator of adaptative response/methylated-DNA-[protein]-cysteine methyltransferase
MTLLNNETGLRSGTRREPTAIEILFYATGECATGKMIIARSIKGVCAVLLGDDEKELESDLATRFPEATLVANEAAIRDDLAKVARFIDTPSDGLDLTLDMRGTPLQRRVWEAIRNIRVGKTKSYMQLARSINGVYPQISARVVANACAANPIALAIPCHRVIRGDGELAGYRWGLQRKRELLEKEAAA